MATASFRVSNVELNSQSQTSGSLSGQTVSNGLVNQVIGYAPTEFATLSNATCTFQTVPGVSSTNSSTNLRLPVGAIPLRIFVTNNGTTVTAASQFDIGVAAVNTSPDRRSQPDG